MRSIIFFICCLFFISAHVSADCVVDRNNDHCWETGYTNPSLLVGSFDLQSYFFTKSGIYRDALTPGFVFVGGAAYTQNSGVFINLGTANATTGKIDISAATAYSGFYDINHVNTPLPNGVTPVPHTEVTHHITNTNYAPVASAPTQVRVVRTTIDGQFIELSFPLSSTPGFTHFLTFKKMAARSIDCKVQLEQTIVNEWNDGNGNNFQQYSVISGNPGIFNTVNSFTLQVTSDEKAAIQNLWNLDASGTNQYVSKTWITAPIAPGGTSPSQFGYIKIGTAPAQFQVVSTNC